MVFMLWCNRYAAAVNWREMSPSQHLYHGLLRRSVGDARQPENQVVYASTMVNQYRYPAQGDPGRIANEEHISMKVLLHVIRQRRLRLRLAHNIVVAGSNNDFYAFSYGIEPLRCSYVLIIYVHYGQIILLTGIDAYAVYQVPGNHHVFYLRGEAGRIFDLPVEPLRKSLPGLIHEIFASNVKIRDQ